MTALTWWSCLALFVLTGRCQRTITVDPVVLELTDTVEDGGGFPGLDLRTRGLEVAQSLRVVLAAAAALLGTR